MDRSTENTYYRGVKVLSLGGTEATYKIPKRIYGAPNSTALQNRPRAPRVYRGPADHIQVRGSSPRAWGRTEHDFKENLRPQVFLACVD